MGWAWHLHGMDDYNRAHFPEDLDEALFAAFKDCLKAGDRAPTGPLTDAASGETVELRSLWRGAPLVIEFGSFT